MAPRIERMPLRDANERIIAYLEVSEVNDDGYRWLRFIAETVDGYVSPEFTDEVEAIHWLMRRQGR